MRTATPRPRRAKRGSSAAPNSNRAAATTPMTTGTRMSYGSWRGTSFPTELGGEQREEDADEREQGERREDGVPQGLHGETHRGVAGQQPAEPVQLVEGDLHEGVGERPGSRQRALGAEPVEGGVQRQEVDEAGERGGEEDRRVAAPPQDRRHDGQGGAEQDPAEERVPDGVAREPLHRRQEEAEDQPGGQAEPRKVPPTRPDRPREREPGENGAEHGPRRVVTEREQHDEESVREHEEREPRRRRGSGRTRHAVPQARSWV